MPIPAHIKKLIDNAYTTRSRRSFRNRQYYERIEQIMVDLDFYGVFSGDNAQKNCNRIMAHSDPEGIQKAMGLFRALKALGYPVEYNWILHAKNPFKFVAAYAILQPPVTPDILTNLLQKAEPIEYALKAFPCREPEIIEEYTSIILHKNPESASTALIILNFLTQHGHPYLNDFNCRKEVFNAVNPSSFACAWGHVGQMMDSDMIRKFSLMEDPSSVAFILQSVRHILLNNNICKKLKDKILDVIYKNGPSKGASFGNLFAFLYRIDPTCSLIQVNFTYIQRLSNPETVSSRLIRAEYSLKDTWLWKNSEIQQSIITSDASEMLFDDNTKKYWIHLNPQKKFLLPMNSEATPIGITPIFTLQNWKTLLQICEEHRTCVTPENGAKIVAFYLHQNFISDLNLNNIPNEFTMLEQALQMLHIVIKNELWAYKLRSPENFENKVVPFTRLGLSDVWCDISSSVREKIIAKFPQLEKSSHLAELIQLGSYFKNNLFPLPSTKSPTLTSSFSRSSSGSNPPSRSLSPLNLFAPPTKTDDHATAAAPKVQRSSKVSHIPRLTTF